MFYEIQGSKRGQNGISIALGWGGTALLDGQREQKPNLM